MMLDLTKKIFVLVAHTLSLSGTVWIPSWGEEYVRLADVFNDSDALCTRRKSIIHLKENDLLTDLSTPL